MASRSLNEWHGLRTDLLSAAERECWHSSGRQPPTPLSDDALVRGYVMLVAAQFQGFCRDLYTECVTAVTAAVPPALRQIVQVQCEARRELAGSNARYECIRADFERFGLDLKAELSFRDPSAQVWVTQLGELYQWRNYVAHDNPLAPAHGGPLSPGTVMGWQAVCNRLAAALDAVMYDHLQGRLGSPPW